MGEWQKKKLGEVAQLIMGQSPDGKYYNSEGKGMPFLQGCSEFGKFHPETTVYSTDVKKIAPRNSILFSVRAPVGKTNYADKEYCIGRGIAAIKGDVVDNTYLDHAIFFRNINEGFISQGSTFDSINYAELSKLEILAPVSKKEQVTIASILTTVDQTIEKTEQLIGKYERIKTGLMQDLLTRGIDEQGNIRSEETHAFKDSALGRIPVEWEVQKITFHCHEVFLGLTSKVDYVEQGGVPLVRAKDINTGVLSFENTLSISQEQHKKLTKYRKPKKGDVLISKSGTLGTCAIVNTQKEFSIYESIIVLQPKEDELDPSFLLWVMRDENVQQRLLGEKVGSTVGHLNLLHFRELLVAFPDFREQRAIGYRLNKLNEVINLEYHKLDKFATLKKGLMQDLLTGKVRVDALIKPEKQPLSI